MVGWFVFMHNDTFPFSSSNYVCLCLSIQVSMLTEVYFANKKWNYHQPSSGDEGISQSICFCFVTLVSSKGRKNRTGEVFPCGQKKFFKSLFVVCGPLHGPHITFLLNYPRCFALFVSSWSFAEFPSTRLERRGHCRRSFWRFSKMVSVNTQLYN